MGEREASVGREADGVCSNAGLGSANIRVGFGDTRGALAGNENGNFHTHLLLASAREESGLSAGLLVVQGELWIWMGARGKAPCPGGGDRLTIGGEARV